MFDEVQSGVGRTGKLFAHEHAGVKPDILASAKGLGGGFPIGACLATKEAAAGMTAGSHGSTFGGNPLAMAVGNAVLDVVLADGFLTQVSDVASYFHNGLESLVAKHRHVLRQVRGQGLMIGLQCQRDHQNSNLVQAAMDEGLLSVPAGDNVQRLVPPLVITKKDVDEALLILDRAARRVK